MKIIFALIVLLAASVLFQSCASPYYWIDDTAATSHGKKAHNWRMKKARKDLRKARYKTHPYSKVNDKDIIYINALGKPRTDKLY